MEKGVTEEVLFLCIVIAGAIIVGAVAAQAIDVYSSVDPKKD